MKSRTAVRELFVLIVSLATFPFSVRYSCVTVCVPVTWVPCGETVSSSAGTSASTGSPSPPDMISPGLVGCGGMTMLLSSSSDIKISGNRSFVWFKRSLPFWGMGRNLLKVKVSSLAGINPLQIISQPILHPCSRPIDKSRQLQ